MKNTKIKKNVLVTGASRGIGKAIAEKFLSENYCVYGTYFSSLKPMEVMQKKYGKKNFVVCGPYDFRDLEDTEKLLKNVLEIQFDAVVINAGIFIENDDFINFELDIFNQTMNCNFYTPLVLGIRLQANIRNGGSITIVSSNDAYNGAFGSMSYSISKAALLSLTKCLCVNYGRRNIRVNSIAPGAIDTDMNTPEQLLESPTITPIERVGQPEEVANIVYFLASSGSSFVNGENITIDGGYGNVDVLLKKETGRIREYKSYDYIVENYKSMKKGDKLIHLVQCDYFTWNDSPEEQEILKQNCLAEKRGTVIERIVIVNKENENAINGGQLIKKYRKCVQPQGKLFFVKESEIIKYFPDEYAKNRSGFGVLNEKEAFIDSYGSTTSIGYVASGDYFVKQLVEFFYKILEGIEKGKIQQFKMK